MGKTIRTREKREDILAVIGVGGFVQYPTDDERLRASKLRGKVVAIKPKRLPARNLRFHRKFFALLKLGFTYWSPQVKLVSDPEQWIAKEVAQEFCQQAGMPELFEKYGNEIAQSVIDRMARKRSNRLDPEAYKSPDNYRKRVMVEAGFYELEHLPDGGAIKVPWSVSFENMTEERFDQVYKGCFNIIWNNSLFQIFENESEMERAVNQLMEFA